jgi:YjbE family integral membrane protein
MLDMLGALGGIVLVDLALSGDNALVIGAAASSLAPRRRLIAVALGGGGAVVARVLFAVVATVLLGLPLVQAIGGALLVVIAIRLLVERGTAATLERHSGTAGGQGLIGALLTILVADVTMSLDNVLAVSALAHGDVPLLIVGLLVSIALLLVGSALVATLIQRLPWMLDLAALVLGWTGARMLLEDRWLARVLEPLPREDLLLPALLLALVLAADVLLRLRDRNRKAADRALSGSAY